MEQQYSKEQEKGRTFQWNPFYIYETERKNLRKRATIFMLLGAAILIISIGGDVNVRVLFIPAELIGVVSFFFGLMVPLQIAYLKGLMKKCPRTITICKKEIWVDDERYDYEEISKISVTSPMKEARGWNPVNHYLKIRINGKKKTYWLASDISYGEYDSFCNYLARAVMPYHHKIL